MELFCCLCFFMHVNWRKYYKKLYGQGILHEHRFWVHHCVYAWCKLILVDLFGLLLNYLVFQSFDFELTWWMQFQKRVVRTKLDIYLFSICHFINTFGIIKYKHTSIRFEYSIKIKTAKQLISNISIDDYNIKVIIRRILTWIDYIKIQYNPFEYIPQTITHPLKITWRLLQTYKY